MSGWFVSTITSPDFQLRLTCKKQSWSSAHLPCFNYRYTNNISNTFHSFMIYFRRKSDILFSDDILLGVIYQVETDALCGYHVCTSVKYELLNNWTNCLQIRYGWVLLGARGSIVGWGTMLQTGRSRVGFPMRSLDFSIDLIFPAAIWPCSRLSL
jgi:hypothetical protein